MILARHGNGKEVMGEGLSHESTWDNEVESLRVRLERLERSLKENDEIHL